jgi:uncharacterized membrane protein YfcA
MSVASVATYSRHGYVDWRLAVEIAAGGVLGAAVGGKVVGLVKAKALRRIFCVFMIVVGGRMILDGIVSSHSAPDGFHHLFANGILLRDLVTIGTGILTGFASAMLGIGGGMIMVPAMVFLLGVPQHTAQGVSLAAMMPTAFTGMLMHHSMGNVEFRVAKWVGTGVVCGALIGAGLAGALSSGDLKIGFGSFLAVMALLMALKKDRDPEASIAD